MKILSLNQVIDFYKDNISATQINELKNVDKVYPVKISDYYAKLSLKNKAAFMQAFPSKEELIINPYSEIDPLCENSHEVIPGFIHKYKNKAIILTTNQCFMNCRHCTRKRLMREKNHLRSPDYSAIIKYLKNHPEINDILLTGGDVLTLEDDFIISLLEKIENVGSINSIRIGTRAPVTYPERITDYLFQKIGNFKNVWINTQFNHPCELTLESINACLLIQKHGIPICNQTVILKGINDNYEILHNLFLGLVHNRIIPYYLYQCDNVIGVSHFITSPEFGAETIRKLRLELPGMAVPRYIIDTQNNNGKIIAEYGNVISLSEKHVELINNEGQKFMMRYSINSPKIE